MSKRVAVILIVGFLGWGAFNPIRAGGGEPPAGGQTFVDALRAAGWSVEVLSDGSLQLTRSTGVPSAPEKAAPPSPGALQAQVTAEESGWSVLRDYGWRVEADAGGARLLYPPKAKMSPSPTEPEPAGPTAQIAMAKDLNALLVERGWRVEREADGSLSLFPLRRGPTARPHLEPSLGTVPPAVADGAVKLPVNTWERARAVSLSWLESVGDPSLRLGKIRRIHHLYLISIVDANAPHALRHQISVGVIDGRVMVLN